MLPEQKIEISKARFDHAKECLQDAKLLLTGERYRSAANRAYYAIFHAMRAVLALDGVDMKHHSGIISEFRKRYIKTDAFDTSLSGIISELSSVREGSDYNDFSSFPKQKPSSRCRQRRNF
ncbi:MAG: HEPN domain-containing protein [Oscillospiraceae bacterium]